MTTPYRRTLLKLSGEGLAGGGGSGTTPPSVIGPDLLRGVAEELRGVHALGIQLGVVVGGGNIIRGLAAAAAGMERSQADAMGMLASAINALALQDALERVGVPTRVLSAIGLAGVAERFSRRRAIRHLEAGRIVVFAGGTGHPYFTTDTAAALRAAEIGAEVVLKATRVDGVYDADPARDPDARRYDRMTFAEAIERGLGIMDQTALALCRENGLPIRVFDMRVPGNVRRAVSGEAVGTLVEVGPAG